MKRFAMHHLWQFLPVRTRGGHRRAQSLGTALAFAAAALAPVRGAAAQDTAVTAPREGSTQDEPAKPGDAAKPGENEPNGNTKPAVIPPRPRLEAEDVLQGGTEPRDELLELFAKVERRLEEIDGLLYDAGAGERALSRDADSGIGELLRGSMARGGEVLKDIDRILEIARQQGGACNSALNGSASAPTSTKNSPLDSSQSEMPRQREQTPERPDAGEGQKPEDSKEPKPTPEHSGQPRSPGNAPPEDSRSKPSTEPPPQGEQGAPASAGNDNERWGELPIHLREIFRAEGGGDLPPQYREWIESYWRRLNQTRRP